MSIRNKITLVFVLLTASLLLGSFLFVYYLSYRYTQNAFYQRLKERVVIAEQFYLKKDNLSAPLYDQVREKHLHTLQSEKEAFFKVNLDHHSIVDSISGEFPKDFFSQIFQDGQAKTKGGDLYHYGMLFNENEGDYIVTVSAKDLIGEAKLRNLWGTLSMVFLAGLVVNYILGRYYAGRVLRPISNISDKATEITASNLHLRLYTGKGKDELEKLAATFNDMLDRLETSFEKQNNFVNNASHELRTPLTTIIGESELSLKKDRSPKEYKHSIKAISAEAQRLDLLINSLLMLAQTQSGDGSLQMEQIQFIKLMNESVKEIDRINPLNQIRLQSNNEFNDLLLMGNYGLLKIAFTNLLDNACKFSENKEVNVLIDHQEEHIVIRIIDKGMGIPEEDIENVLEPFYRASNARSFKGYGIGLALTQKIIHMHNGQLHFTSRSAQGTVVNVILPASLS